MPVAIELPGSLSQRSYAPSLGAFQIKHLYIYVILSVIPHYKRPHYFSATCDDKVMIVALNSAWQVLIEDDNDDSLQFAKVFPAKFLKLPIRQSFPPPLFCTIKYITPLVINSLGGTHTRTHAHTCAHTHINAQTKANFRNQACTSLWPARTWLKN